jgi:hypothetical protein
LPRKSNVEIPLFYQNFCWCINAAHACVIWGNCVRQRFTHVYSRTTTNVEIRNEIDTNRILKIFPWRLSFLSWKKNIDSYWWCNIIFEIFSTNDTDEDKGLVLAAVLRGQAQCVLGDLSSDHHVHYTSLVKALEERFAPPNQIDL